MTKQEKTEALDGMVASIMEAAMRKSFTNTSVGGQVQPVLSPQQFRSMMFNVSPGREKSIVEVLMDQGVLPAERVKDMKRILDVASNIQLYDATKASDIENEFSTELAIMLSRLTGSGIVGMIAKKTKVGSSIIIHGAAARYAQKTATKLPQNRIMNILVDAFSDSTNDYEKLRMLITKSNDPLTQVQNSRQLHAWLIRAGYYETNETVKEQLGMLNIIHDSPQIEEQGVTQ